MLPGAHEMNVVSVDMGAEGLIVRFVLSAVRPKWSWEDFPRPEHEQRPCLTR